MLKQELYAFWKYDQFPFVCCGTVTSMMSDGWVEIKEYGKGYLFNPIKIVPLEQGLKIKRELDALTVAYRKETEALHKSKVKQLKETFDFIK